ncbi:hypothetical protein [Amycolatopsis sp. WGS_07]|uniref:hypothetical protein n=1 Tax=Amycolatopsis sp. WGS_07 TaxID=3076764 RepID=UPI003873393D
MTTTSMRRPARAAGLALSLALGGLLLAPLPAQAAVPQSAAHQLAGKKTPVHIKAEPVKAKLHKGEQLRVHGHVATGPAGSAARGDGGFLYLQQQIRVGVWVNLASTSCSPGTNFDLGVQLNVSGSLTLRVYHPESALFTAAASAVFTVAVF